MSVLSVTRIDGAETGLTVEERMDALINRLISANLTTTAQIRGCNPGQIRYLESPYNALGYQYPGAYRLFLEKLGRGSGGYLSNEISADYSSVSRMTRKQRREIAANRQEWVTRLEEELLKAKSLTEITPWRSAWFDLPESALIICGRYEEQFWFILCDSDPADDASVFYYSWQDDLETAGKVYDSLFDFWNAMADDAERRLVGQHNIQGPINE